MCDSLPVKLHVPVYFLVVLYILEDDFLFSGTQGIRQELWDFLTILVASRDKYRNAGTVGSADALNNDI